MTTFFIPRSFSGWNAVFLSLAQVAPEEVEVTVGGILAALLVLGAFTGSLLVLTSWRSRMSRGESVIPSAARPGVMVPGPLLMFGLLIAVYMASSVLSAAITGETVKSAATDADSAEVDSADSDSQPATEAPPPMTVPAPENLEAALLQTAILDVLLIVLLGIPIWWIHRERIQAALQLSHGDRQETEPSGEAEADDLKLSDPYSAPREQQELRPVSFVEAEPWVFGREFRYAAEAVLAAWLPTALLRLITVLVSQDESQHPFLELISNGVSAQVLLLIAGTAVFLAPLMEELLYRVVILGGLLFRRNTLSGWSSVMAVGVSSVLFALAHGFPDSLALLPLAVIIGWTYHQRRSYRTVVLIHFLFNAFNVVIAGLGML